MSDTRNYEPLKSEDYYKKEGKFLYTTALCQLDSVRADDSGTHHKIDHELAQFESRAQAEAPRKKDGPKHEYLKVVQKINDITGEVEGTNRVKTPVKKFFNIKNPDLRFALDFFRVELAREFGMYYDSTKQKPASEAVFDKAMCELLEKKKPNSVAKFIFTIGRAAHVDSMIPANIPAPESDLAAEYEKLFGTNNNRPTGQARVLSKAYLSLAKAIVIHLSNYLIERCGAIRLSVILMILRNLNVLQRAEGHGAILSNAVFDELAAYVTEQKKAAGGDDEGLPDMDSGEVIPKPKKKPAARKKAPAKKGGKAAAKKNTPPPEETFEENAVDEDDSGEAGEDLEEI